MIFKFFYLAIYYGFARWLPNSHKGHLGRWGGGIRRMCAYHLFKKCGKDINIERGAWFGKGAGIEIGDKSGIGVNCHVPNDIYIGNDVMMGPNCYILNNTTHRYDRIDIPMIDQGMTSILTRTIIEDDVWIGRQTLMISGKK